MQRDEAWVKSATPEEIHAAFIASELVDYSSVETAPAPLKLSDADQALLDWTKAACPEDVVLAQAAGKLDSLLGREPVPVFPVSVGGE